MSAVLMPQGVGTGPPNGTSPSPAPAAGDGHRRLSVDDYHRMLEVGILRDGDPVELLDGFLVEKMPISVPHSRTSGYVDDAIRAVLPVGWHVQKADPITLRPQSEPEPDVAVVRGRRRDFDDTRHPGPADLGLVVEVAYPSYARDRHEKGPVYARDGIPD